MSAKNRRRPIEEITAKREARREKGTAPASTRRQGIFDPMPKVKLHSIHQKRVKK